MDVEEALEFAAKWRVSAYGGDAVVVALADEIESLRAAMARVRDLCEGVDNATGDGKVWAAAVLEELDGET